MADEDDDDQLEEKGKEENENNLANWLQYGLPMWIKKNGSYLILAAALCFLGWMLWRRHVQNQQAVIEDAYVSLVTIENPRTDQDIEQYIPKLQALSETTDVQLVRGKALLDIGNTCLNGVVAKENVIDPNLNTKYDRSELLDKAETAFKQAADSFPNMLLISGKAHLGLAAIAEDRHNWDEARAQYEILTTGPFAATPFATLAQDYISQLPAVQNAPDLASMLLSPSQSLQPISPFPGMGGPTGPTPFPQSDIPGLPSFGLPPINTQPSRPPLILPPIPQMGPKLPQGGSFTLPPPPDSRPGK